MSKGTPVPLVGSGIPTYTAEVQNEALAMNYGYDMGRAAAEIDKYGLYNSGGFRRVGAQEVSQAIHNGEPAGLVIGDIDGLKAINDELGHPAGDIVIDKAKAVIKSMVEDSEVPIIGGRIGGDEFAMLVKGDAEQTKLVAEEFERRYREYADEEENGEFKERGLSFSVGYAALDEETKTFSELMRKADERMYENKVDKLGDLSRRDRLCLIAAKGIIKLSTKKRLRDAPKYWRKLGILD